MFVDISILFDSLVVLEPTILLITNKPEAPTTGNESEERSTKKRIARP